MIFIHGNIVLYSTGCPKCEVLKKKLTESGVLYEENHSVDEMLALGITQVPVLEVDGTMMDFKSAVAWVNKQ